MEIESGKEKRETAQNGTTLLAMYVSTRKNREKKKCKQTVKHTPKKKKARKSIRESSGLVFLFGDFYEQRHICA